MSHTRGKHAEGPSAARRLSEAGVPHVSRLLFSWFGGYSRRFVRRHFHAVRLSGQPPDVPAGVPLVIYLNHPSWWDPLTCLLLARRLWPDRRHFAPIDARMLEQYRFFSRLGFFGVEPASTSGGIRFLRVAMQILAEPQTTLWVTAQGELSDVRRRPIVLRPGLAHLLRRVPSAIVLPIAIEYPFWTERTPELLVRIGEPLHVTGDERSVEQWNELLSARLERTMDELAELAHNRNPAEFKTLLGGASGTSRIYDAWRGIVARVRGKPFSREHLNHPAR